MTRTDRILVAAPADELDALKGTLTSLDYEVCAAEATGSTALAAAGNTAPDLALVDLGMDGAPDVAWTISIELGIPMVYLVEGCQIDQLPDAQAADPVGYVVKPFDPRQLQLTVDACLASRRRLAKPRSVTEFPREVLLATIFQAVNEGVSVTDRHGVVRYANPASARLVGMETPETANPRLREYRFYGPDMTTPIAWEDSPPARAIRLGAASENVEVYLVPPGRTEGILISMDAKPLYDEGQRTGCLIVSRDITEAKNRETELKKTADRLAEQTETLNAMFDGIADGVALLDPEGNVLRVNPPGFDIVSRELVRDIPVNVADVGVFYADRVTPVPEAEQPFSLAIRGETCDGMRLFVVHSSMPDGLLVSVSARRIATPGDTIIGVVLLFRDVAAEHQREQALIQAFSEGRQEAASTVLHNVGNALNSVATGIESLRERLRARRTLNRLSAVAEALESHREDWIDYLENDPQGQQAIPLLLALHKQWKKEYAGFQRILERSADRVQHVVGIMRAQQSSSLPPIQGKTVPLKKTLWDGVRIVEPSLRRRGIAITVDCARAPHEIEIHESRFHQMLVNLLRNAIEAMDDPPNDDPGHRPAVGIVGYVEDGELLLDVTDNGAGIEPNHLLDVFAPGFTTKPSGSGLGLHSAANYVIESGGRIAALSDGRGCGTTIRVQWPLELRVPSAREAPP